MGYYRLRPKDNPKQNGIVVSTNGKLEVLAGDYSVERIFKKEALRLKEDAENWKMLQGYVVTDAIGRASIIG